MHLPDRPVGAEDTTVAARTDANHRPRIEGTIRAAIIGCGGISTIHAAAIRALPDVTLVGFCDRSAGLARKRADAERVTEAFDDAATMIEAVRPHVVHILTPPDSHRELLSAAATRGVHAYIEKPFALTSQEAQAMAAEVRRSGVTVCPGHNRLFDPIFIEARKQIAAGRIGRVVAVNVEQGFSYGASARAAATPWSFRYAWGVYDNLMPHALYLATHFLDTPGDPIVHGLNLGRVREMAVEEMRVVIPARNGTAHVLFTSNGAPELATVEIIGTLGRLFVSTSAMTLVSTCERGLPGIVARFARGVNTATDLAGWTTRNVFEIATGRLRRYPGIWNLVDAFYRSLREGSDPPVGLDEGVLNSRLLEAIRNASGEFAKPSAHVSSLAEARTAKVLVTGATGQVGGRLVQRLSEAGTPVRAGFRNALRTSPIEHVHWIPLNLRDETSLREALVGVRTVFHCGALVAGGGTEADFEETNVTGTTTLARLAAEAGVDKLVYVSSISVYGIPKRRESVVDDSPFYDSRAGDRGFYTQSKLRAEIALREYAAAHERPQIVILRPGLIYGPGYPVPFGKLKLPSLETRPFISGPRRSPIPLSHLDNVIDAILLAERPGLSTGTSFNIVDDPTLSQGDVARTLRSVTNDRVRARFVPYWVVWTMMLGIDFVSLARFRKLGTARYRLRRTMSRSRYANTKAQLVLGWKPAVDLENGLRGVLEAAE